MKHNSDTITNIKWEKAHRKTCMRSIFQLFIVHEKKFLKLKHNSSKNNEEQKENYRRYYREAFNKSYYCWKSVKVEIGDSCELFHSRTNTWIGPKLIIVIIECNIFMWRIVIIAISNMRRCRTIHMWMVSIDLLLPMLMTTILKMQRIMVVIMQMMVRLCFWGIENSFWQICCTRWCCCWSGGRWNTWYI